MNKRHRIDEDFNKKHRLKYRQMDQICKHDGFCFSDKLSDWMFSKYRKHAQYKHFSEYLGELKL